MALSGDHVIRISEIPGGRWDLALEQLDSGGAMTVVDGEPPIGLQRYVGWPGADGHVHVSIFTDVEPQAMTQAIASRDAEAGLQTLATMRLADRRLGRLLERHGVVREYVFDYGHGAVRVGAISNSGEVTLL